MNKKRQNVYGKRNHQRANKKINQRSLCLLKAFKTALFLNKENYERSRCRKDVCDCNQLFLFANTRPLLLSVKYRAVGSVCGGKSKAAGDKRRLPICARTIAVAHKEHRNQNYNYRYPFKPGNALIKCQPCLNSGYDNSARYREYH